MPAWFHGQIYTKRGSHHSLNDGMPNFAMINDDNDYHDYHNADVVTVLKCKKDGQEGILKNEK
jgi:hypothetical protein